MSAIEKFILKVEERSVNFLIFFHFMLLFKDVGFKKKYPPEVLYFMNETIILSIKNKLLSEGKHEFFLQYLLQLSELSHEIEEGVF